MMLPYIMLFVGIIGLWLTLGYVYYCKLADELRKIGTDEDAGGERTEGQ
jgi:hypothetical protein